MHSIIHCVYIYFECIHTKIAVAAEIPYVTQPPFNASICIDITRSALIGTDSAQQSTRRLPSSQHLSHLAPVSSLKSNTMVCLVRQHCRCASKTLTICDILRLGFLHEHRKGRLPGLPALAMFVQRLFNLTRNATYTDGK